MQIVSKTLKTKLPTEKRISYISSVTDLSFAEINWLCRHTDGQIRSVKVIANSIKNHLITDNISDARKFQVGNAIRNTLLRAQFFGFALFCFYGRCLVSF